MSNELYNTPFCDASNAVSFYLNAIISIFKLCSALERHQMGKNLTSEAGKMVIDSGIPILQFHLETVYVEEHLAHVLR